MASWVHTVQKLLKALRESSSTLLQQSARLFVQQQGGSADNLVLDIREGGPADDHPTIIVETLVRIVRFILEKRCLDEAALEVFGQRKNSDNLLCGFATALCIPPKHPWVHRVREPVREGGGGGKRKTCKGSDLFQRKVVRLREASRAVLKEVIVFEALCAYYRSDLAHAGRHSPRGSMESDDDLGQDPVEDEAGALVAKYQDTLECTGRHQAHLSAALQIM
jgi:hypothetical protein